MIYYADLQSTLKTFLLMSILKQNKNFCPTLSNKAIENWLLHILVIGKTPIYVTKYKVFQKEKLVEYAISKEYTMILVYLDKSPRVKYNIITPDDKLISPTWYDRIEYFGEVFKVRKDGQDNYMKKDGTLLSPNEWFFRCYDQYIPERHNYGWIIVNRKGGGCNYINSSSGNFLSQTNFLCCTDFNEGFGRVKLQNGKWNFIDLEGNLLLNTPYDLVHPFHEGFAAVAREGDRLYNFIDLKGNILCPTWYNICDDFKEGFAKVYIYGKGIKFIKNTGEFLDTPFLEEASDFNEGLARVKLYEKGWNYLRKDGSILLPGKYFTQCSSFESGQAEVFESGNYYYINYEGKKIS